MTRLTQVISTVDSEIVAQELARQLVQQRLAACVQVEGPITSYYRWREVLEQSQEWRIVAKTTRAQAKNLERWLVEAHPYETPEILCIDVDDVSAAYAAWVAEQVGGESGLAQ